VTSAHFHITLSDRSVRRGGSQTRPGPPIVLLVYYLNRISRRIDETRAEAAQ